MAPRPGGRRADRGPDRRADRDAYRFPDQRADLDADRRSDVDADDGALGSLVDALHGIKNAFLLFSVCVFTPKTAFSIEMFQNFCKQKLTNFNGNFKI